MFLLREGVIGVKSYTFVVNGDYNVIEAYKILQAFTMQNALFRIMKYLITPFVSISPGSMPFDLF